MRPSSLFLRWSPLLTYAATASTTAATPVHFYSLIDTYLPANFFDKFNFFTDNDPTGGYVDYKSQAQAQALGLISTGATAKWGVGLNNLDPTNSQIRGRPSVRLEGKTSYTKGLFIADIAHMPGNACGIWPAFWTLGSNWPFNGEIDIIENVNNVVSNKISLHTGNTTCKINSNSPIGSVFSETGSIATNDCETIHNGIYDNYVGCGIQSSSQVDVGNPFNQNKGGVYAMEWTETSIKTWFFPRSQIPSSIQCGAPDMTQFGTPTSWFNGCDIASNIKENHLVFDTTFCGTFAGASGVYGTDGICELTASTAGQSCIDFVARNGNAYTEAFWEINYIKVFQQSSTPPSCPVSSSSISSSKTSSKTSSSSKTSTISLSTSTKRFSTTSSTSSKISSATSSTTSPKVSSTTSIKVSLVTSTKVTSTTSTKSISTSSSRSSLTTSSLPKLAAKVVIARGGTLLTPSISNSSLTSPSSNAIIPGTTCIGSSSSSVSFSNTSKTSAGSSLGYSHIHPNYPAALTSGGALLSPVSPYYPPAAYNALTHTVVTTVITMKIVDICSTGLTTGTITTTMVLCPTCQYKPGPLSGFRETVKLCASGCGPTPTYVTCTVPVSSSVASRAKLSTAPSSTTSKATSVYNALTDSAAYKVPQGAPQPTADVYFPLKVWTNAADQNVAGLLALSGFAVAAVWLL